MNIEQLIADLRARVNPQYYDQVGTESYERNQCVLALEYLATENERLKELMAKRTREHQQEMTSFRLRVRSQDDATFAALRDEVNGLTGSLDRAEKALKEAQEQPAVAWMIHEYQGTGEKRLQFQPHIPSIRDDVTGPIVTALYARPVPAAPAEDLAEMRRVIAGVADRLGLPTENGNRLHDLSFWLDSQPAVPDATCKQCLQVDRELREVIAGLVAIAEKKGKRQGSPNHCHQRPGIWDDDNGDLAGKPCSECAIYDRARALLQSTGDKK